MPDGGPEPEADLSDFFAFWTGDEADDLGGVCAESGLLCWWEAKLGPGWVRETGYFPRNSGTLSMSGRRNGCNGSGSTAMWSRT